MTRLPDRPLEDSRSDPSSIQEAGYRFPYHYIPRTKADGMHQSVTLRWGYLYLSYLRFLVRRLEEYDFDSLLDVGCGDGRFLFEVAVKFPDVRLMGVDSSERAILLARAMNPWAEFRCDDITRPTQAHGSFDIVAMIEVLEHIPPAIMPAFVAAVHDRVAAGGRLIVTVPSHNLGMNPKHYQHFDLESLIRTVSPGFALAESFHLNRKSRLPRMIDRLLTNRFVAVREPHLLAWWLGLYERRYLEATASSAMRICAVFTRTS